MHLCGGFSEPLSSPSHQGSSPSAGSPNFPRPRGAPHESGARDDGVRPEELWLRGSGEPEKCSIPRGVIGGRKPAPVPSSMARASVLPASDPKLVRPQRSSKIHLSAPGPGRRHRLSAPLAGSRLARRGKGERRSPARRPSTAVFSRPGGKMETHGLANTGSRVIVVVRLISDPFAAGVGSSPSVLFHTAPMMLCPAALLELVHAA